MKISVLQIIGDGSLAGAPRHLLSILENLDLAKFELHTIAPPGPLAGEIRDMKRHIDLEVIPMNSRLDLNAIRKIRKTIKSIKPDIIHIHGTRAGALGRLAAIGLNRPDVYTEHLWTKQFSLNNRLLNFFHFAGYWILDLFTNLNIAVSGAVKEFMVDANISRAEKIKVIYNGIEHTNHSARIFKDKDNIRLITVGSLNEQKGMQFLIRALPIVKKEFPNISLEIVGDGPYKRQLVDEVKKRNLRETVKFTGFLPNVDKYLADFDLYIQPSLSESFGLAIVQAMSVGLPVVATLAGGIPEVVTEGKSGFLVKPTDHKALAQAILEMLRDPEMAKRMGENARAEARARFELRDMIHELENTYEKVYKNPTFTLQSH